VTWPALTATLALLGVLVAVFSAWIQEKKLRFELFVRRFDAYEAVNLAISQRITEIQADKGTSAYAPAVEELRKFWEARRPMRHLFPGHFDAQLEAIEARLVDLMVAHTRMAELRNAQAAAAEKQDAYASYMAALADVMRRQEALGNAAAPYLRQETALEGTRRLVAALAGRCARLLGRKDATESAPRKPQL
jgi:hypothetical protein